MSLKEILAELNAVELNAEKDDAVTPIALDALPDKDAEIPYDIISFKVPNFGAFYAKIADKSICALQENDERKQMIERTLAGLPGSEWKYSFF